MKEYDVIVIGAGDAGLGVAFRAAGSGQTVALIEKSNVGGTCTNVGCVPSKTLIHPADRLMEIEEASRLGISVKSARADFATVMKRMKKAVTGGRAGIEGALKDTKEIDRYKGAGRFAGRSVIETPAGRITGKKIFIATGARPDIPPVKGMDAVPYLTNESVLKLTRLPKSIVIIGGGTIAVEYGHFFAAMGSAVTIVQQGDRLVAGEEPEIAELLRRALEKRSLKILTNTTVVEVGSKAGVCVVGVTDRTGKGRQITAERILLAAGRRSNADQLDVERAAIATDAAGYIQVDDYLRTSRRDVWAVGDAAGRQMFTHAADKAVEIAWHNATHQNKLRMPFDLVPRAVFTWPQIASVGMTEARARKDHDVLVGRAQFSDVVMGDAMGEKEGFAKAVVEKKTRRILGFHIVGPHAAVLIQEVVSAVAQGGTVESVTGAMHIFPSLSGLIPEALGNLR